MIWSTTLRAAAIGALFLCVAGIALGGSGPCDELPGAFDSAVSALPATDTA